MMKNVITTTLVVMTTIMWLTSGASIEDARRLNSDLLSNCSRNIRPVLNQSDPLVVELSVNPVSLVAVNEIDQSYTMNVWMNISWRDEQLTWNISDYGGISTAVFNSQQLWLPSVIFPNSLGERDPYSDQHTRVSVKANGYVEWYPSATLKLSCPVVVRYFPFDTQRCEMRILPQSYTVSEMLLVPSLQEVNTAGYTPHNEWILGKTELQSTPRTFISKRFSHLSAKFVFIRRPVIHVLNIILPVALLSLLSVLVFLLPAESGERVSFAFTSLLSITMYMSIVSSQLPRASDSLPLVTVYLSVLLVLNVVAVVATCLSLLCHHRYQVARANPHTHQSQPAIVLVKEMDKGDKAGDDGGKDEDDASKKMWVDVWSRDWAALLDKVFFVGLALAWVACTLVFMVVISSGGCGQDDCLQ